MTFRFLHSSDWHIGKPFGRFDPAEAHVLQRARLTAIDRLAAAARADEAGHVLVAGDIYDRTGIADKTMREPIARLAAHRDIRWHLMPGNHDPSGADSIWERVQRDGLPENVRLYVQPSPVEIEPGVWLLPAPLGSKALNHDPTAWMCEAKTPVGAIRIGLAHGSTQGFGSTQSAAVLIAADRARSAGLDYLALGDWHGVKQVAPATWYSGTPEPDGFLDNDPGSALSVSIAAAGSTPSVQPRSVAEYAWIARTYTTPLRAALDELESTIASLGIKASQLLVEIDIAGEITAAEDADLSDRLDRVIAPRIFHLSRRTKALRIAPDADDLATLGDGVLAAIATELMKESNGGGEDARVSDLALRQLFQFARTASREAA